MLDLSREKAVRRRHSEKCWRSSLRENRSALVGDGTDLKPLASTSTSCAESTRLERLMIFELWGSERGRGGVRLGNTSCIRRVVNVSPSPSAFFVVFFSEESWAFFYASALKDSYSFLNNFPTRRQMAVLSLDIILRFSRMQMVSIEEGLMPFQINTGV